MSQQRTGFDLIMMFGVGVLAGAAAALLLAPKSGAETRQDLNDLAEGTVDKGRSLMDQARARSRQSVEAAGAFVEDQKRRAGDALREGKEAFLRDASKG